jgi:hypothetical protein
LEVDRFARHQCPLLENAAIALQQGHVAMGHLPTSPSTCLFIAHRRDIPKAALGK